MIAAALFYRFSSLQGQMSSEEIQARFPTFEATSFTGQVFDKNGLLKYNIESEQVVYYQDRGLIKMQKPIGLYFDHKDTNPSLNLAPRGGDLLASMPFNYWKISADQGHMVHNKEAVLEGNVKIEPSSRAAKVNKITTPYMFYDLVSNQITSREEIKIEGDQFIDQGRDYILDLNAKTFVIKEKPHAVYYP